MSTQADFAAALLDVQLPYPKGLCSRNGADPSRRFAVYRNNVQSSLINALADSYPVVQQLVGEEFFRAMAAIFVRSQPPQSPLMSRYGEGFADFIGQFEPSPACLMWPMSPDSNICAPSPITPPMRSRSGRSKSAPRWPIRSR